MTQVVIGAKAALAPGDTLTMAQGLPRQTLSTCGREPTSMAFFSAAGSRRLYSGVTNKTGLHGAHARAKCAPGRRRRGFEILVVERQIAYFHNFQF